MKDMDVDSEATADLDLDNEQDDVVGSYAVTNPDPLTLSTGAGISESAPPSKADEADYGPEEDDAATESEGDNKQDAGMPAPKPVASRRSRASSPEALLWAQEPTLDDPRLTARQRARLEKEAGLAENVQWHEMELPPELQYTWKGKGYKAPNQMTEEEWLKRQEALERRRMRSLRDKREAEETVKAKIRKAVTARFRGKLIAQAGGKEDVSGSEGEALPAAEKAPKDVPVRPGWVKLRHDASGSSIAWHSAAHQLSYPMSVVAGTYPGDPVDLPLQPAGQAAQQWQVPEQSSGTFKPGCKLAMQQGNWEEPQQQLVLMDQHGWAVGCLPQQQVLDALEAAGYQPGQQLMAGSVAGDAGQGDGGIPQARSPAAAAGSSCGWQAEVRSVRWSADHSSILGVVVRLQPVPVVTQ